MSAALSMPKAMHRAGQLLVGRHDFTTFRSAHCQANDPVKTLDRLDVRREDDLVLVEVEARSFLHHQVRSMVGTLALVGLGQCPTRRWPTPSPPATRAALGLNAPAEGLYFVEARYPEG
jgi:tRNA pseudouridine38-40 synthase